MKVKLYNQKAEVIGEVDLSENVFGAPFNADLVYQAAMVQRSNQRKVLAHTKGRGEVRGGGKKPWRQKGTGRARHGSIRSPLWRGGGVTHGPTKEKNFSLKINTKMRRRAIASLISDKVRRGELFILDTLTVADGKTKHAAEVLKNFFGKKPVSILFLIDDKDESAGRAYRNLDKTKVLRSRMVNALDLLNHRYVMMTEDAAKTIENTLNIA